MLWVKIGVLASGRGSNLQAIMDNCQNGYIPGKVVLVLSDNPQAYALERAEQADIPAISVVPGNFAVKELYEQKLVELLQEYKVDLVCLAGYMRLVGKTLLDAYPHKIINIHPALLPAFPGLHGQEQAFNYGVRFSGCTVHFVDAGMDTGPIILQKVVSVEPEDDANSLAARILVQEHQAFPEAVKYFAEGRLTIQGRKVIIKG